MSLCGVNPCTVVGDIMERINSYGILKLTYSEGHYHMTITYGAGVVAHYMGRMDEIQDAADVEGFSLDVWDFLEVYAPLLFTPPRAGLVEYTALLHPEKQVYCIARGIASDALELYKNLDRLKPVTQEVLQGVVMLFPDMNTWENGDWSVTRGMGAA